MPDISMCKGVGCPLKENCYRFKAKPDDMYQSYFVDPPFNITDCDEQPSCDYFWSLRKDYSKVTTPDEFLETL